MNFKRRAALCVLAVTLTVAGSRAALPAAVRAAAAADNAIDAALSAAVARGDVPGIVAAAATADRVLYLGAFGQADVGQQRPMTADALFRIASMTKPVTSVA
jgi:methyl acetate hydrolase